MGLDLALGDSSSCRFGCGWHRSGDPADETKTTLGSGTVQTYLGPTAAIHVEASGPTGDQAWGTRPESRRAKRREEVNRHAYISSKRTSPERDLGC